MRSVTALGLSMVCLNMFYCYETININYRISSPIAFLMSCAWLLSLPLHAHAEANPVHLQVDTASGPVLKRLSAWMWTWALKLWGTSSALQQWVRRPTSLFGCNLGTHQVLPFSLTPAIKALPKASSGFSGGCFRMAVLSWLCPGSLLSEEGGFVPILHSSVVNSDHWSQCLSHLIKMY